MTKKQKAALAVAALEKEYPDAERLPLVLL